MRNHNDIREHFKYALALGDGAGLSETSPLLQRWVQANEPSLRRYSHDDGTLDLICDVLAGARLVRDDASMVIGPLNALRVGCAALIERDAPQLVDAVDQLLEEHARTLERRTSPPPPVCEWALYLAVAAQRVGLDVPAEHRFAHHQVPISIGDRPGEARQVARVEVDLLGRPLWDTGPTRHGRRFLRRLQ